MAQKITRPVSEPAVRAIGISRRSLTGRVAIGGISIPFESSLERDFVVLLDFDPAVVDVKEQPVRIHYKDLLGRNRHYTPDFFVEYDGGQRVLYEIKYREDLKKDWAALRPRFRAAVRYARANGMRFSIMTDVEIRGSHFLRNAMFLRGYRNRPEEPDIEEHLVCTLAVLGETTPEALLAAAYKMPENRMKAVGPLWRLLATGRVYADFHHPLTMTTSIWVTVGEGYVWQDPHSYRFNPAR